jgi:hypothetical protein
VAGGGVAALAAAGLFATTLGGSPAGTGNGTGDGSVSLGRVQAVALQTFTDCDSLLRYYRTNASKLVTPWGLEGSSGGMRMYATDDAMARVPEAATAATGAKASDTGATSETGTNVQVAGVDEADVAKLSGDLMVTLEQNRWLHTLRAGRTATSLGTLDLAPEDARQQTPDERRKLPGDIAPLPAFSPAELLVHGTTAIVIGSRTESYPLATGKVADFMPMYTQRTRLAQVDLSDPARPRLVRTLDLDGNVSGARLVDGVLRLVVDSSPDGFTWRQPTQARDGSITKQAEARSTSANRRIVGKAGLDSWLPDYDVTNYDAAGKATPGPKGRLVACEDVASPKKFAGVDTLSLVSADLDAGGLADLSSTAVVARGATVYATPQHTYVATAEWQQTPAETNGAAELLARPGGADTSIHLFETRNRVDATYVASGNVAGTLVGQFAMDEYEGDLRVASTTEPAVAMPMGAIEDSDTAVSSSGGGAAGDTSSSSSGAAARTTPATPPSESRVTILRQQGEALTPVGTVRGLGRTEHIRSVRFIGDLGYVVTFRQTDPLYTIDLSDPAKPKVAGELKILGYSAYLHPAGPGRLLGIGQDADAAGRTKGMQISLFDIADPANPKRLDAVGVGDAWTDVEGDHHAFTFADGLALAPYQRWWQLDPSSPTSDSAFDTGVLAVRLGGSDLQAPKTLRPLADGPARQPSNGQQLSARDQKIMNASPLRTFVRDGVVYTVTNEGVAAHDATTMSRLGFTEYR